LKTIKVEIVATKLPEAVIMKRIPIMKRLITLNVEK
jgi:hypothetical protein